MIGPRSRRRRHSEGAETRSWWCWWCMPRPHPNLTTLQHLQVDTRDRTLIDVVCGAPTWKTGMKSVFAFPGTYIPARISSSRPVSSSAGAVERHAVFGGRAAAQQRPWRHHRPADDAAGGRAMSNMPASSGIVFDISITPNRRCDGI